MHAVCTDSIRVSSRRSLRTTNLVLRPSPGQSGEPFDGKGEGSSLVQPRFYLLAFPNMEQVAKHFEVVPREDPVAHQCWKGAFTMDPFGRVVNGRFVLAKVCGSIGEQPRRRS